MDKRRLIRSGITFSLACCLLTLTIQACSSGSTPKGKAPAPISDISPDQVRAKIKDAPRPYILLNFFATWCKPCRRELPELVAMQHDTASLVEVMLFSIDEPDVIKSKLHAFVEDNGIDFQTYAIPANPNAFIAQFYTLWDGRIPLSLLYSREGRMVEALTGLTDRAEIELIVNLHSKMGS